MQNNFFLRSFNKDKKIFLNRQFFYKYAIQSFCSLISMSARTSSAVIVFFVTFITFKVEQAEFIKEVVS